MGFCFRKLAGRETQPRDGEGLPAKDGGTNPYANKAYDVRLNTPNAENVVFIEFKSIKRKGNADKETAPAEKVDNETDDTEPVVNGVDGKGIDVEQLLGYLADSRTIDLNSIRYVLNAKKMDSDNPTNATLLARQKMQLVFKNNATLLFNTLQPIGKFQTLFGVQTIQQFLAKVNDVNDSIFSFVITN